MGGPTPRCPQPDRRFIHNWPRRLIEQSQDHLRSPPVRPGVAVAMIDMHQTHRTGRPQTMVSKPGATFAMRRSRWGGPVRRPASARAAARCGEYFLTRSRAACGRGVRRGAAACPSCAAGLAASWLLGRSSTTLVQSDGSRLQGGAEGRSSEPSFEPSTRHSRSEIPAGGRLHRFKQ